MERAHVSGAARLALNSLRRADHSSFHHHFETSYDQHALGHHHSNELRDAAKVDGLSEWQIFLYVYVPVMRSTYAAATIIIFMANWNNYLWPLIALQTNEMKTVTQGIATLLTAYQPDYGVTMVATTLATLPTLFIFFVLQRQFVQGLLGSVK
jgi:lactose/L-arabinose transport system permease protein